MKKESFIDEVVSIAESERGDLKKLAWVIRDSFRKEMTRFWEKGGSPEDFWDIRAETIISKTLVQTRKDGK